jgi:hypothetical protein
MGLEILKVDVQWSSSWQSVYGGSGGVDTAGFRSFAFIICGIASVWDRRTRFSDERLNDSRERTVYIAECRPSGWLVSILIFIVITLTQRESYPERECPLKREYFHGEEDAK